MAVSDNALVATAYAKINLSLDVLGRREDGFHQLRSVMQTVSLCDTIRFATVDNNFADKRTAGQDLSLIDRAIAAVSGLASTPHPTVYYSISKNIPAAAGLGGGSTDCAAALRSTAHLLGADPDEESMIKMAAELGSDVPFFLTSGTALVEGRGERVTPLVDAPESWFLLANSGIPVSTAEVFMRLDEDQWGNGSHTDIVLDSLAGGHIAFGGNDLTNAAIATSPDIGRVFGALREFAPDERITLSGSGGTVVALFDTVGEAVVAREEIGNELPFLELAMSVDRRLALRQRIEGAEVHTNQ